MSTYIVFFGSSDRFEFQVYDISNDDYQSTQQEFKNLDQLDPKYIIPDSFDNEPVFGKYKFRHNQKVYTLLKIYQCAQSNVSSRITGSNIGIAIISENNLALNFSNINLLEKLLVDFKFQALNDFKFRERSFKSFSENIFESNKDNLGKIDFDSDQIILEDPIKTISFAPLTITERNLRLIRENSQNYSRVYICVDKPLIERSLLIRSFKYLIESGHDFISLEDFKIHQNKLKRKKREEKIELGDLSSRSEHAQIDSLNSKVLELEQRITQDNKNFARYKIKIKFRFLIFMLLSLTAIWFFTEENTTRNSNLIEKASNPLKDAIERRDTFNLNRLNRIIIQNLNNSEFSLDSLYNTKSFDSLNLIFELEN
jgi:hypothetical protein